MEVYELIDYNFITHEKVRLDLYSSKEIAQKAMLDYIGIIKANEWVEDYEGEKESFSIFKNLDFRPCRRRSAIYYMSLVFNYTCAVYIQPREILNQSIYE